MEKNYLLIDFLGQIYYVDHLTESILERYKDKSIEHIIRLKDIKEYSRSAYNDYEDKGEWLDLLEWTHTKFDSEWINIHSFTVTPDLKVEVSV